MTQPLLTIVIPVYNRAGRVVRTLDSIAVSSYRPFSIIIVDNNSTDDTFNVCRQWAESHRGKGLDITVTEQQRKGSAAARNLGLELCSTEYIYFFDSDDCFSADFIATIIDFILSADSKPDLVCMPVRQQVGNNKPVTRDFIPNPAPHVHTLNAMLSTQSMLFRTAWLRELGGWDEQLFIWNDWELGLRSLLANPNILWYTQRSFHIIDIHPDSITGPSLSSRVDVITTTLCHAHRTIMSSAADAATKHKALCALSLRASITAGKMSHEGSPQAASQLKEWTKDIKPSLPWHIRIASTLLRLYSSVGGRGAWRLAIMTIGK